jgi:hypothetical protein
LGRNELNGLLTEVADLLKRAGGILPEKKAITMLFAHGRPDEVKQVIDHMINAERVKRVEISRGEVKVMCLCTPEYWIEQEAIKNLK